MYLYNLSDEYLTWSKFGEQKVYFSIVVLRVKILPMLICSFSFSSLRWLYVTTW